MELSISINHFQHLLTYLGSSVYSGPCLEELPHHTGVAFGGCNHQCSVSILRQWRRDAILVHTGNKSPTESTHAMTKQQLVSLDWNPNTGVAL